MPLRFTIFGNLASKSNSRKLVTIGGRTRFIKSERALSFQQTANLQIPAKYKQHVTKSIKMTAHIYYDSRRPDLDPSLLMDILEKAGVYQNDRQIVEQHLYKHLDKNDPRVEVVIEIADFEV